MVETWYAILALMLTAYLVLDGGNIGAGLLHFLVAKTAAERRQLIGAIGPLWPWHEVWLVAFGGTLFVAFPVVLATALAGFYLAIFLLLWSLVLRGLALEVGGHLTNPLWHTAWNFVLAMASLLLAVLIGVALGNIVRGVPLDATQRFSLSFFTNFRATGRVGILDWYTVAVGVFTVALLGAHGTAWLTLKTEGPIRDRSEKLGRWLWPVVLVLLFGITLATGWVRPVVFTGMGPRPVAWLAVALVLGGAGVVVTGQRHGRERQVWAGSCAFIVGLMGAGAASVFPVMLHSTLAPQDSLTAYNGAAAGRGLGVALIWWPFALVLSLVYYVFIAKLYRGKIKPS